MKKVSTLVKNSESKRHEKVCFNLRSICPIKRYKYTISLLALLSLLSRYLCQKHFCNRLVMQVKWRMSFIFKQFGAILGLGRVAIKPNFLSERNPISSNVRNSRVGNPLSHFNGVLKQPLPRRRLAEMFYWRIY